MSRADKTVYPYAGKYDADQNGLTLLEHYSGEQMAKAALVFTDNGRFPDMMSVAAEFSVMAARALIAELEKQS